MKVILIVVVFLMIILFVMVFDLVSMFDVEKVVFGLVVCDYLMENFEVLVEVINGMEVCCMVDEVKNDKLLVE